MLTSDEIRGMGDAAVDAAIHAAFKRLPPGMSPVDRAPLCHSDLNACHAAEERLAEMGLAGDYAFLRLADVARRASSDDNMRYPLRWYEIHASARDRARAILAAVQEAPGA